MDTIDLDAIINTVSPEGVNMSHTTRFSRSDIKSLMLAGIHQSLVLASEKAETTEDSAGNKIVDKQSILDVYLLIK